LTNRTRSPIGADAAILVVGQLAIGSAALMARYGLDSGLGALAMAGWRLAIASVLLVAFLHVRRLLRRVPADEPIPRKTAVLLLGAGACLGLHFVTWFASLQHIGIGVSTLLVSTSPVWAGLAEATVLRKPPPKSFWVGLIVALAGLAVVSFASRSTARGSIVWGCTLAALGAVFLAAYLLMTHDSQTRLGTWRTVSWTYSGSAAFVILGTALFGRDAGVWPLGVAGWGSVVGMALIPQLAGHTSMNYALTRFAPGVVGVATLLEPVFAAAIAWPAFGEPITAMQAAGAVVLMLGVGVVLTGSSGTPGEPRRSSVRSVV
jgi:drug/metabolite transporter (DMT)-like permease